MRKDKTEMDRTPTITPPITSPLMISPPKDRNSPNETHDDNGEVATMAFLPPPPSPNKQDEDLAEAQPIINLSKLQPINFPKTSAKTSVKSKSSTQNQKALQMPVGRSINNANSEPTSTVMVRKNQKEPEYATINLASKTKKDHCRRSDRR